MEQQSFEAQKNERFEARIPANEKEYFQRAAKLQGVSLADFVRAACNERAARIFQEQDIIKLSRRDRERFIEALLDPPQPNAALVTAAKRYRKSGLFRG
mgnify:CR=1 FL=1